MLPTASKMRQITKDNSKEIKMIAEAIRKAAENGNYSVDFEFPSDTAIIIQQMRIDYLVHEKDYRVTSSRDNPNKIIISW
jgi:hypothetical protein